MWAEEWFPLSLLLKVPLAADDQEKRKAYSNAALNKNHYTEEQRTFSAEETRQIV